MSIEFLCPNGHQLTAPAERAGKPGKCPKCGSRFVVPEADEDEEPAAPAVSQREETIAFLCPNGHELTGPARLQGRPGQCPHCGEKFRIPVYDEADDEAVEAEAVERPAVTRPVAVPPDAPDVPATRQAKEDIPVGTMVADSDASPDAKDVVEFPADEAAQSAAAPSQVIADKPPPLFQHSLARAFFQLWSSRENENPVELKLRDGETIQPVDFSAELSQEGHGVFAVNDENGFTIVTVPWDEMVRVRFREMKQLPKGLFE